eukprot:14393226-Alexandrium_andersonii.AAC.1
MQARMRSPCTARSAPQSSMPDVLRGPTRRRSAPGCKSVLVSRFGVGPKCFAQVYVWWMCA